ncbi:S8 family peptidase [Streptomyces sp. NBC_00190]|uniref:S8 family peptidase n=1 Tax=unclassified Streptomyces TaxID=2593676 RepID=UPI002E28AD4E|nr:S8 family serine peptidase [Streptomyces sp. NBC_00190]WSZ44059.1 S8 family peptidase [Streptomyces sp. NBC_00868]
MNTRPHLWRRCGAAFALAAALALGLHTGASAASPPEGSVRYAGAPGAVAGSYLVLLDPARATSRTARGRSVVERSGGKIRRTYDAALNGYSAQLTERQARRLAADPAVAEVAQNRTLKLDATQPDPPSWGLSRIDQRRLPLDAAYAYPDSAGQGVTAYIIDTGVHITHEDFGGRASYGYDAVDDDMSSEDDHGHGTHVAGTVAGSTHGVAKQAKIVAVRVLDYTGQGTTEQVVAGVDWVTRNAAKPAVANMSLGGDPDDVLDAAVRNSIASGITYAVAAGNQDIDASGHSPARVQAALTVGAVGDYDHRASYSNYGPLVDLFAPGDSISSAAYFSDDWYTTMSGTSMATPHVTGVAALHLSTHRTATPAQVGAALTAYASTGSVIDPGPGSANRLLYAGGSPQRPPGRRFANTTDYPVADQATVDSPITVSGVSGTAPADLDVEIAVRHPDVGDLRIDVIAPDGTAYPVKDEWEAWIETDYTVVIAIDASSRTANGVWRLRVFDTRSGNTGYIDSWALRF